MIKNISNIQLFQKFLKLCAGRIGQLVNLTSLGNDCGITAHTVTAWLSILEMSYIIFFLYPHFENFNKRLVKMPKIYFYDTGLACSLLGIEQFEQVQTHYLRGGLFESLILSDLMKQKYNQGFLPNLSFWRDQQGNEIDCILQKNTDFFPIEIKSSQTFSPEYFRGINYWKKLSKKPSSKGFVIYAGDENQERKEGTVLGWKNLSSVFIPDAASYGKQ